MSLEKPIERGLSKAAVGTGGGLVGLWAGAFIGFLLGGPPGAALGAWALGAAGAGVGSEVGGHLYDKSTNK